ncbi:MAG: exopolysaccharide biosynthesis polyprenyl glycosylphosphotransferase, partial [Chloroflexota bacterium]|nr:exopolysaccharide biosynthesis polyprenyl glycosylphosphotransferase [Chloroflexota bacterium]
VPFALLASKLSGLYERDELVLHKSTLDEAPALFQLATLYTLLAWMSERTYLQGDLGRPQVLALWVGLFVALLVGRRAARLIARGVASEERCLAIGEESSCKRVRARLQSAPRLHARVVAQMPMAPRRSEDVDRDQPTWTVEDLEAVATRFNAERVIIAPGTGESDELLELVQAAKALGLNVTVVPRVFEVVGSQIEWDDIGGMPVLGVRRFTLSRSSRFLKRTFDLVGATVGLIVTAPLAAAIAMAIKLDSRGPVLCRSPRIGCQGRRIVILKFRTMVKDADELKAELRERNEADGLFKIADDPRATRVGRWLRKTSLDELPQLVNVLRGDMSLVGPRPLVEEEDQRVQGWHRRRLELTPGMTGHWQILGSARIPLHDMMKIDYLYVASWSLWTDVKILLRTIPYVLQRRGM